MKSEWKKHKIGDVCTIKHGYAFKGVHFCDEKTEHIVTTPGNFAISGGFKLDKPKYYRGPIPQDYILSPGDIIVTMTDLSKDGDTLGYAGIVPESNNARFLHNQRIGLIENISDSIDKGFLYWLMRTYHYQKYIVNHASGSTVKHTSPSSIASYSFQAPPLPIQRKIASILSALDDKIETNNAICRNMEEQIKLIFKDTYASKVKDSSARIEDVTLADVCSAITKGTTPSTLGHRFENVGVNFVKAESITNCHRIENNKISFISLETHDKLKRSQVEDGDILFSIAGTLGRFTLADTHILPANTNQAVAIIRANKEKVAPEYLYSLFIAGWHEEYCKKNVQQAVQANLSLGIIKSLPIFLLLGQDMNDYLSKITPLITMMKKLERESNCLSSLRDVILPKLMNGEFV